MHKLEISNYSFTYAGAEKSTLSDINIEVREGEYILLCGTSGSGKTTFLKSIKPEVTPNGLATGSITLDGKSTGSLTPMESACKIGYVFQSPENQIVTDTVQHEMSFGLENLGIRSNIIRRKVAETAGFFGIDAWFNKKTAELSGGQKQLLNLASVVVMEPEILLLDEPTAQLDPIASKEFLSMLARLNRELGITVIICEHRFEEVFSSVSSVVIIQDGKLSEKYSARDFAAELAGSGHPLAGALPAGIRISGKLNLGVFPLNVNESRNFLTSNNIHLAQPEKRPDFEGKTVIELKDAWFRYDRQSDFVIRDTNIKLRQNEIHAIVGGNGMGKSTVLRLMSGISRPDRGKCRIYDKLRVSLLMQDPKTLFVCDSVHDELREMQETFGYSDETIKMYTERFGLDNIESRHPYDLSGGEMQKLAMVKVLLTDPDILLLDEPTKGTDAENRHEICSLLNELKKNGKTILFVTHDLEFAAETADTCSFMFNGQIICTDEAKQFFTGNRYYTTAVNRITRGISDGCVTLEDVNIEK